MKAIKDFSGYWNPDKRAIQFKWDVSGMGNDRYIYIIGLKEENNLLKPDISQSLVFDICDMRNRSQSSTLMQITNLKFGVYKMRFCAYSMPQATICSDEEIIKACESDPAFTTTVMMGRASIAYVAESSIADNAKIVKVHLKSDSDIAEGVLGYRYVIDNCEIVNAFPGNVRKGKFTYPAILIPRESEIQIAPIDRQFSGNLQITPKKSKLLL